mgnify:CR=1 FL=1
MQRLNVEYSRIDERGTLIQINTGVWKQINYLSIKKNQSFGGHYHKHKKELFYVLRGFINMEIEKDNLHYCLPVKKGQCFLVEPYETHTIFADRNSELIELLSESFSKKDTCRK